MNFKRIGLGVTVGTIGIAATSIGIQYYNKCDKLQDDSAMKRNRNFLIVLLVVSILLTLWMLYSGFKGGKKAYNNKMKANYIPNAPGNNGMKVQ